MIKSLLDKITTTTKWSKKCSFEIEPLTCYVIKLDLLILLPQRPYFWDYNTHMNVYIAVKVWEWEFMDRNLHLKKLIDRLKFKYVERSECFRSSANYNSIYLGLPVVSKLLAQFCVCCNITDNARPSTLTSRLKTFWNVLFNKTHFSANQRYKRVGREPQRFTEELHLSITKRAHKLYLKSLLIYGFFIL